MNCPICKKEFNPAGFSQHAKKHVRTGELVRLETVRAEQGNKSRGYAWSNPFVYVKPRAL